MLDNVLVGAIKVCVLVNMIANPFFVNSCTDMSVSLTLGVRTAFVEKVPSGVGDEMTPVCVTGVGLRVAVRDDNGIVSGLIVEFMCAVWDG